MEWPYAARSQRNALVNPRGNAVTRSECRIRARAGRRLQPDDLGQYLILPGGPDANRVTRKVVARVAHRFLAPARRPFRVHKTPGPTPALRVTGQPPQEPKAIPSLDGIGLPHYSGNGKGGLPMPKYLIQARYTSEGIQGLVKDSASGRRADVQSVVTALGGKIEAFYYAFGDDDVVAILDLPSSTKAAALGLSISGSGAVRVRTTPLLTVEDVDQALEIKLQYRAPGK